MNFIMLLDTITSTVAGANLSCFGTVDMGDENVLLISSLFTWNSIGAVLFYIGVLTGIYLMVRLFLM